MKSSQFALVLIAVAIVASAGCNEAQNPFSSGGSESGSKKASVASKPSDLVFQAVDTGDVDKLTDLLRKSPSLANARGDLGETPLTKAVFWGRQDIVDLLISKGANVNSKTDFGETPLDKAVFFHKGQIAATIQKHGGKAGKKS